MTTTSAPAEASFWAVWRHPPLRQAIYAHARGRNPIDAARHCNIEAFKYGGVDMDGQWGGKRWTVYPSIIREAVMGEHLEMIKYLYENVSGMFADSSCMDWAARVNRLDIMQYLHERGEVCTEAAMTDAVNKGHMEVVKWIHENCNVRCSPCAIEEAAFQGDLEMVRWLYENRPETSFVSHALTNAVQQGHLEVVKYLREHSEFMSIDDAISYAIGNRDVEMVTYLCATNTGWDYYWFIKTLTPEEEAMFKSILFQYKYNARDHGELPVVAPGDWW